MSAARQFLIFLLFASVWIFLTHIVTDSITHRGANLILGMSRTQLFVGGTFLGGLLSALIYYGLVKAGRKGN